MNSDTLIRQLAEADNFAPGNDLPASARTSAVALTEIRRRIDNMDAKELTKPVEDDPKSRSGWLIAAAAFAVVVAVLGVALLLNQSADDAPPATTPTTISGIESTTVTSTSVATDAPPVDAADQAVLDSYVATFNSGDEASFRALFSSNATKAAEGGFTNNLEAIVDEMRRLHLRGTTIAMDGCDPSGSRIMCSVIHDGPVEQAVLQSPEAMRHWFTIVDGEIVATESRSITQGTVDWNPLWEEIIAWVGAIDPEAAAAFGGIYPHMPTDAAAVAWRAWAPMWREAQSNGAEGESGLDIASVALVSKMISDINANRYDAAVAPILNAGTFESTAGIGGDVRMQTADRWMIWVEMESTAELLGCNTLSTGTTRCEIARSSPHDWSTPDPELSYVQLRLADGEVAFMRMDPVVGAWNTQYELFARWIADEHPELTGPMFTNLSDPSETADLVREYYALWLDSQ